MLLTKFFLPELRSERVDRPRLFERLKQSPQGNLVIVSAPAGFGKTTLVSAWVHAARVHTAWISLDESDNDPVRFWSCLVTAVDKLMPGVGANCQSILSARQPPVAHVLLTTLLNDLALQASRSETEAQPACLVLDDTHLVTNAAVYEGLLFLVERLPSSLRLVLIGRSDPPLPLGRLRVSNRVIEIRAADLRFTLAESEDFLNRVMGFSLSLARVKRLDERTEGWIAGLQLAGLAMQGLAREQEPGDINAFIDSFSGDDRYILDYLVEEVLNNLPKAARTFLLQTSILDRMCGSLCDAVTGLPEGEGQAMLERFERENLFLIPLDNRRLWYRYHHLFADLLRHQLERQGEEKGKESASVLHRRAACWFAGQQFVPEAIGHALRGRDFEHAVQWIEAYAWSGIDRGEYATLKKWIDALPQTVLYSRPDLLMRYAWTLAYLGEVEQYEQPLAAAERLWREQGNLARLGEAFNLRADFAATYGDGETASELAQQALALLPEEDLYHRGMSWIYLGGGALLQGCMHQARQAFITARDLCERNGNATGSRMAINALVQVHQAQGNLQEAAQLLGEILSQTGDLPIYEGLTARMLLSVIWREWNRMDEAEQALRGVLEIVESTGQMIYFQQCYLILALTLWEKGDLAGMRSPLEKQARLADQVKDPTGQRLGHALNAQISLLSGDIETALSWRKSNPLSVEDTVCFQNEFIYLTLTRLLVRLGAEEAREALVFLEKLQGLALSQQRFASLIEIKMIKALGMFRLNDISGAIAALEESMTMAIPGGYTRLYLDEGQPLFNLLDMMARKPSLSPQLRAYAAQIRSIAPDRQGHDLNTSAHSINLSLIEPLTPREIEVLRMIKAGHSNREIAEKLYLTLNTVKVHAKNIFAKLEVESRTRAVHRAEELGLI